VAVSGLNLTVEEFICGFPFLAMPPRPKGNVINLRGKPFWKRVFPLNPFPKTFKSFRKMAWKKPFFKRFSSNFVAVAEGKNKPVAPKNLFEERTGVRGGDSHFLMSVIKIYLYLQDVNKSFKLICIFMINLYQLLL